jgi:hypothetical protein
VNLTATQNASIDFALQTGTVRWSDLSGYQGKQLLPDGKGKDLLERDCFACHMFQTRMAATPRDEAGWTQAVKFMREAMHSRLGNVVSDGDATVLISYLNSTFGIDSRLPRSPAELPGYQKTVRKFSDEAMKIEYVEYEMPAPNRMPFSATPDRDGKLWIPDFGRNSRIPGAQSRHCRHSFSGAFAGWSSMDCGAGFKQGWEVGSQNPNDYRVSGRVCAWLGGA